MQNRKRPADIIRFAAPGNRKTHTQVKTHRLRILFIDIDRIGFLAGDGSTNLRPQPLPRYSGRTNNMAI